MSKYRCELICDWRTSSGEVETEEIVRDIAHSVSENHAVDRLRCRLIREGGRKRTLLRVKVRKVILLEAIHS